MWAGTKTECPAEIDSAKVRTANHDRQHSFRAIDLTDTLENGGDINLAKRMASHANIKTTELYDRRGDEMSFSEIERVEIFSERQRQGISGRG